MRRPGMATAIAMMVLLGGLGVAAKAAELLKATAVGSKVPNSNSLRDLRGNSRPLDTFKGNKATVLVFLGTECPVSKLYVPRLVELEKKLRSQKVQFLAIYPNEKEDLDQLASSAYDLDLPFLVLKDEGQRLATLTGVERVPTVVVIDDAGKLRYRGRVDDQYAANVRRPAATRDDLGKAIEEVLAGKDVSVGETEAEGCLINRTKPTIAKKEVNYSKHVATILQKRCEVCHREDQTAPFTLQNYDDAVKHAEMIREVTSQRRMPPWQADPRYGHFSNDRRMSQDELDTLLTWIDTGMQRGDDKDLPKPIQWTKGWLHGKPDLVITMPREYEVPAEGVVPYQNYIIDTGFTEDRWVKMAEGHPGSPSVIHHIVVYILKAGTTEREPIGRDGNLAILVGWAPGDLGLVCPPDTAIRIPKGAKLRFEMHYTPNGKATKDRSSVGMTFAKEAPKYELFLAPLSNMSFEISPNSPHHRAEASMKFRDDARIISLAPHMHWRGKDYFYEAIYPDGRKETLLSVPRWDFNWQHVYRFEDAKKVPKGTRIHTVAHWDNSTGNPANPDPKKMVRFGLQTWEEMMVGFAAYVWERPETALEIAKNPPSMMDEAFERLDVNGDDVITLDELPGQMRMFMQMNGTTLPEKMTKAEFVKVMAPMMERMQRNRRGGGAAPRPDSKAPDSQPKADKKTTGS